MTQALSPEQVIEVAKLLAGNYIERRDVMAVQFKGGFVPKKQPFILAELQAHVDGTKSLGHYLVTPSNTVRMFAFDIDLNKESSYSDDVLGPITINPREIWAGPTTTEKKDLALQLKAMAHGLMTRTHKLLGCKVTVHYSGGKGMHVIGCLDPGTPAVDAREMMNSVLMSFGDLFECYKGTNFWRHTSGYPSLEIETFPKQDEVSGDEGFGNLLRLPMGIHAKSGKPSFFMDMMTPLEVFQADDPIKALTLGSLR